MRILYQAGDPWTDVSDVLIPGPPVAATLWLSFSGTVQLFRWIEGDAVRVRVGADHSRHFGDGFPLLWQSPSFATSCGCGDASGYRSTSPAMIAHIETLDDAPQAYELGRSHAHRVVAEGFTLDVAPEGHPDVPCLAEYCTLARATATPGGADPEDDAGRAAPDGNGGTAGQHRLGRSG